MDKVRGYLGTYASPRSRGIYTFTLDRETGRLSVPELYSEVPDCKYLSLWQGTLACPVKRGTSAGICLLDTAAGKNDTAAGGNGAAARENDTAAVPEDTNAHQQDSQELLTESAASCYVTQDDSFVYTANYHEGTVLIYQKSGGGNRRGETSGNGLDLVKIIESGRGAGCHQVLLHERYLMVPCLLQDRVRFFDREQGFAPAGELVFPKGTGPRHGCFDREHRRFFLVSELSNQVFTYEVSGGTGVGAFKLCECLELLNGWEKGGTDPASAAIRLSPDERHLYVSTRFADVLSVFHVDGASLTLVQQTGSGGAGPRDFILTKDGRYLLAVNRTEGGLVCFGLNPEDGGIERICSRVPAVEAVGIVLDDNGK